MTTNIQETVNIALDNLRPEAHFPLIQFAKKHLDLDIEKQMRDDIVAWAKKNLLLNKDWSITNKALSSLDGAIDYVQKMIGKSNPKIAKKFFNYIKDKYAKMVVDKYMEKNKEKFAGKITTFGKDKVLPKIFKRFDKENVRLPKRDFLQLKKMLATLVSGIEDNHKTLANVVELRNLMKTFPENVQNIILDKIMKKRSIGEDLQKRFYSTVGTVVQDIQEGVNETALRAIRSAQVQEIYQYDGLIERYLPASVRGLHNVSRQNIEKIAIQGDNPKSEDLLNFEIASRARQNPNYSVGHTGPSNRSSTLLSNIAMYFASNHGLKNGKPESIWLMIYEPTKGINTTELVNKQVKWTELECATKQLKSSHFLGAVQFDVDNENTNGKQIAFKAVDGFVNPKVHQGKYSKEGIEGDLRKFLEIAKHYDKPEIGNEPDLSFKLPKNSTQVTSDRTFFQSIFDKIGLSTNPEKYRKEREKQVQFVQAETPQEKSKRLAKEKEEARFWHEFAEKAPERSPKVWAPTYRKLVSDMEQQQRKQVDNAARKLLRTENKPQIKQTRHWR